MARDCRHRDPLKSSYSIVNSEPPKVHLTTRPATPSRQSGMWPVNYFAINILLTFRCLPSPRIRNLTTKFVGFTELRPMPFAPYS